MLLIGNMMEDESAVSINKAKPTFQTHFPDYFVVHIQEFSSFPNLLQFSPILLLEIANLSR